MKITLIRHTSVEVPPGTCYGQTDVPLRETFEQEAQVTQQGLAAKSFDKVYTSPLSRCVRLANYCGYPDAERDKRLMEINFGEWEMQKFDEIKDPRVELWYEDYHHVAATGGESFAMQYQRVSAFLEELRGKHFEQVALFVHGGVIICAQIYAGVLKSEEAFEQLTPYGGIVEIEI
jgi:alpha-ribazole phosphatase